MPVRSVVLVVVGEGRWIREMNGRTSRKPCSADLLLLVTTVFGDRRGGSFSGWHFAWTTRVKDLGCSASRMINWHPRL